MLTKNSSKGVGDDADLVRLGQVVDRRGPIMRQRGPSLAARWSAIEYSGRSTEYYEPPQLMPREAEQRIDFFMGLPKDAISGAASDRQSEL
ncbi:hypothetical protein MAC_01340 [Metarhizium acridum CQMa 102]|uniref:Uncharacterized protein n=1 Tax=Metarhizium acridum (strain CQMa 102) TaxID=655827 RepID=E9DUP2_METAQ|nr:uncharacterized protein MAC_01340 [Metarhizium acridum CQMa 102]EFY92704.1 hypothetical protein MAC_01340 [Metarhizium acridum CQMa 102]